MTATRDRDRLVQAFLEEGPAELSPRVLANIRDEIHLSPQRASRRSWRIVTMSRPILSFIVLGALVLGAIGIALVGSGMSGPSVSPVPSTAPSAAIASTAASSKPSPSSAAAIPLADGEAWIAYVGAEDDGAVLIRPDGSGRHVLFSDLSVAVKDPRWSPDGRQIVFEGNGSQGSQLWAGAADGTAGHQLTPSPDGCPALTCTEAVNPSWSPDGKTIAYVAPKHDNNVLVDYSLMLLDLASGTTTTVYSSSTEGLARPTWSPDSKRIAFELDQFEGAPEGSSIKTTSIAVIDPWASDPAPTRITKPSLLAGYPAWHPTEDLLAVRTNRVDGDQLIVPTAAADVYTLRPDGTGLKQVTHNPVGGAIARAPSWTSDGRIVYSSLTRAGGTDERLRVVSADGTGDTSATGAIVTNGEGTMRPTR